MISKIINRLLRLNEERKFKILKKHILECSERADINPSIRIAFPERLVIKEYVYIGNNAFINALGKVFIGRGTIIGPNLFIHSANHNFIETNYLPYDQFHSFKEVIINENVWIGANVSIVPGVNIGEGAVVAMGSVVVKDVPPLAIIGGNPAKIISYRNKENYDELNCADKIYIKYKQNGSIAPDYFTGFKK